jgi:hypothetical protein
MITIASMRAIENGEIMRPKTADRTADNSSRYIADSGQQTADRIKPTGDSRQQTADSR